MTRYKRYRSCKSLGTSWQTTAVDCASYCGSCSATFMSLRRSCVSVVLCSKVSGSRMAMPEEPGSNWTVSPPSSTFGLPRSEEHTSELQSHLNLVCRLLLEKKKHTLTTVLVTPRRTATAARA